jgi:DNA-binding transcriptional MerR regulator
METRHDLWTLDELGAQVALALAVDYEGTGSGRVRDVPDARTIRYYTTLGLIDRPAEMRGRTALYSVRHLLQLVSIKRLQARGLSLAEVQHRLLGKNDATLRDIARLPAGFLAEADQHGRTSHDRNSNAERKEFWKEAPGAIARPQRDTNAAAGTPRPLTGVPLEEGITLLFEAARSPDDHDLSALQAAAAPLLKLLRARRLVAAHPTASETKGPTS